MPREGCLFCGGKPLTIEHVIPSWLGKVVPMLGEGLTGGFGAGTVDLQQPDDLRFFIKKGQRTPFEARRPCERCNTGWMHDLEEQVKPWIGQMVRDQPTSLPSFAVRWIAAWCVKTTTFIRYADSPPAETPESRNQWLYRYKTPPPASAVFLARHEGRLGGDWITYQIIEVPPVGAMLDDQIHLTAIRLGQLVLLVVEI